MSRTVKMTCAVLMFITGMVVFFIALQQRTVNEAACVIDVFIAGGLIAPFLFLVNKYTEDAHADI